MLANTSVIKIQIKEENTQEPVPAESKKPETESCPCGILLENISKEELLEKIIENSSGDRKPCKECVYRLIVYSPRKKPYCFVCSNMFPSEQTLYYHFLYEHIPSVPYKCEDCGEKFTVAALYIVHVDICTKHNSCICHLCGKHYTKQYRLKEHMEVVHSGNKHKCAICQKEFLSKNRLQIHIRGSHNKSIKTEIPTGIKCDVCNQIVSKAGLKTHKITKHGTPAEKEALKKHRCRYCGLRFKGQDQLNNHENSNHTGEKPHICKICGKAFGNKTAFKRHQVIHTGEKKFKCDTCGLSFNQKCTLTRHQVVHTGEKPFECGICGQRFTQKPYMMAHKKKHKDGEVMEKKQMKKKKKQESSEESEEDMSDEEESMSEDETSEESDDLSENCDE